MTMVQHINKRKLMLLCAVTLVLLSNVIVYVVQIKIDDEIPTSDLSDPSDPTDLSDPSDVLVNGYHRSGSSFLGLLFNFRNDTFYWFEPLYHGVHRNYFSKDGRRCSISRQYCEGRSDTVVEYINFLTNIYSCRIDKDYNRFHDRFSDAEHDGLYRKCRSKPSSAKVCYSKFVQDCHKSKHLVTKLIRLDVHHTGVLLQNYPKLKLLQLMRDPRGIINSRIHTVWYPLKEDKRTVDKNAIEQNAIVQCNRMRSDIKGAEELSEQFPNRVRIIRYEDIARKLHFQTAIYKWLGMDPLNVNDRLRALQAKALNHHVDGYRKIMHESTLDAIQKHCADVITLLGFRLFTSFEDMQNSSINAVVDELKYTEF